MTNHTPSPAGPAPAAPAATRLPQTAAGDSSNNGPVVQTRYSEEYGPNVTQILCGATRVVRGRVPREVRNQLMAAVKAGVLGRLAKDGLKPEIFFHPDHKHGAIDRQRNEALYAVKCISGVVAHGADRAEYDIAVMLRGKS